ncbi:MAG TPA: helix-turn-helix domain-containing protein [Candidatus Nanoarchaeia archaeon]|nr:helix-turn-helix domain-containing protein [Candidatus Nanoarchaeia archaeon]
MDNPRAKERTIDNIALEQSNDNQMSLNEMLGGHWLHSVVEILADGPYHFNELKREIDEAYSCYISNKTLSYALKNLAKYGVVKRRVLSEKPKRVSYELTESGRDLLGVFALARDWETKWRGTPQRLAKSK